MKILKSSIALLVLATFMVSCKKEKVTPAINSKKVKQVDYADNTSSNKYTYEYDGQGRLSKVADAKETETFSYASSTEFTVHSVVNADPSVYRNHHYILNDKGAVISRTSKYPNGTITNAAFYTYNQDGLITEVRMEEPGKPNFAKYVFEIQDGLITKCTRYSEGQLYNYTTYTYDISRSFKTFNQPYWHYIDAKLTGVPMKHPIAGSKTYSPGGQLQYEYQYTSVVDAAGNCLEYNYKNLSTGLESTFKILYE